MDRVWVRSFRAPDLAERGLKDLARSRIDTSREVVFQALGARFFEARGDVARIVHLFWEDAFHTPEGHFARLVLRVEPQLSERLSALEPRAVESRLQEAARSAILREFPRAQGAYLVHFEPSPREGLEPVAHVHLSCRRSDGGPSPALSREGAHHFEERWNREVERVFSLSRDQTRELEHTRADDRVSVLDPAAHRLREQWARISVRLFAVYTARLAGEATKKELVEVAQQARAARAAWIRQAGPPIDMREVDRRQVFDVVRLRIEGGNRYLRGQLEELRRTVLETAASRTVDLPDGTDRRLAVVPWPVGADLHASVYFNQRSRPERPPGGIDPERLRAALEARLADQMRDVVPRLDHTAEARANELGRVEARLPERPPAREQAAPMPERREEPAQPTLAAAIVVAVDREHEREAGGVAPAVAVDRQEALDRLQLPERGWSRERVFAIRLRIPTGAERLEGVGLSAEEVSKVLQRAVDRAYPFLQREGIRNNFLYAAHGCALDVQIVVPEKLGWTANQLRSPQFQQRFVMGFHHGLSEIGPTRIGPAQEPLLPGLARGVAMIHRAPQLVRRAEQDPERVAREGARALFSKLSEALPRPFRLMRDLGRVVSRFVPRG